ncbi:MAG: amidohydrolase family protein [Planctomycetota bacterium]
MIVDLHTRVWSYPEQLGPAIAAQVRRRRSEPWVQADGSLEHFEQAMAPVDRAVVLGFEAGRLGASIPAKRVAQIVAAQPDRCVGFAGIDPTLGAAGDKLEHALALGLRGVTLAPAAAGFHPTDTRAMELFEACQAHKVPVLLEASGQMAREARLEFGQPYLIDEVAREFPDLKLVLGSVGDPWTDEAMALLAKHPTVFADLAGLVSRPWRLMNVLMSAHQQDVMGQLLFGSDFPWFSPEQAIVNLYSVNTFTQGTHLPSVPREQLRSVVERNALAVLGIEFDTTDAEPPKPDEAASPASAPKPDAEPKAGSPESTASAEPAEPAPEAKP